MAHIEATVQLATYEGQLSKLRNAVEVAKALAQGGRLPLVILKSPGEPDDLVLTSLCELSRWLDRTGIYQT